MKISYAITVCNEFVEIQNLVSFLLENKRNEDEIVILYDSNNGEEGVEEYLRAKSVNSEFAWHSGSFENHFADWKNKLTSAEYHILREKGTDRPFTGKYDEFFEDGLYRCAGCDEELFISETKYNSGCGWPAFYESLPNKIEESEDNSFGMKRIEITCKNCGGHLGHVFNDGPKPTGLRYCINSTSLDFEPEKDND